MNTGLPKAIHWEKPPVKDRHCLQNQPPSHCSQLPLPQIDVSDSSLLASRSSFLACVCPTGGVLFLLETMSIVTLHVPSSIITHVCKAWQARDTHRAQPRSSFSSHVCHRDTHGRGKKQATHSLPIQIPIRSFIFRGSLHKASLSPVCHPAIGHAVPARDSHQSPTALSSSFNAVALWLLMGRGQH